MRFKTNDEYENDRLDMMYSLKIHLNTGYTISSEYVERLLDLLDQSKWNNEGSIGEGNHDVQE